MKQINTGLLAVFCVLYFFLFFHYRQANAGILPSVSTNKQVYHQGEPILVHYSGAGGFIGDWICIVPFGEPDNTAGDFRYLPIGVHDGSTIFSAPGPGKYEVRVYYDYWQTGYTVSARHSFFVTDQGAAGGQGYGESSVDKNFGVITGRHTYRQGEPIQVHFSGAPGTSGDWICIVSSGAPDNKAGDYEYIPEGMHHGDIIFNGQLPGKYEVRAYYNYRMNGYVVSSRYQFTVIALSYTSTEQEKGSPDPRLK
jgi:hypothetical protein